MSLALNESLALQRFKHGNAMKIHNGTMFDFYPGIPHMLLQREIVLLDAQTLAT